MKPLKTAHPKTPLGNVFHAGFNLPDDLAKLREEMLRFTRIQLRDADVAEDVVQDALAAALNSLPEFRQQAALKTWAFKILKNKVCDVIRTRVRSREFAFDPDQPANGNCDAMFDEDGHWQEDTRPANWGDPERAFANQQFWLVMELCLTRLPESTARVFLMREMLGLETDEICKELGISSSNCWVVLHRARMSLRLCLNERWFQGEGDTHEV